MKQLRVNWRKVRCRVSRLERGNDLAVTDLDSERGLANTTIAENGYAPLVHGVWAMCWSEWEKTDEGSGSGGRGRVLGTIDAAASAWVVQVC